MKKILLLLSAAVALLAACQPAPQEAAAVKVRAITLSPADLQVVVGQTQTIKATVAPAEATDKTLEWSCDKTAIATVDQQGVVTGVAVGDAVVTVKSKDGSGAKATCKVKVISASAGKLVTAITLTEEGPLTMAPGDEIAIEAVVDPTDATNQEVDWVFSAREVAKYENGKIIALAEGTTTLKAVAKDGSGVESAPVSITVKAAAPMFAKYKKITLRQGQNLAASTALWAYFGSEDDYSNREDLQNPVWTSGDEAVVTVSGSESCDVTSVGPGSTKITVTDGGSSLEIPVTVTAIPPITEDYLPGISLISPTQLYDEGTKKGWFGHGEGSLGEGYAAGTQCFRIAKIDRPDEIAYTLAQCKFDKVDVSKVQNPALFLRIYIQGVESLSMDGANSQIELSSDTMDSGELTWTGGMVFTNWTGGAATAHYTLKNGWNTIVLPFDYAEHTGGDFEANRACWFRIYNDPRAPFDLNKKDPVEVRVDQLRVIDWTEYASCDERERQMWMESGTANNWAAYEWLPELDGHTGVFGSTDEFMYNTITNIWLRSRAEDRWRGRQYAIPVNYSLNELKLTYDLWVDDPDYFKKLTNTTEISSGVNSADVAAYNWGFVGDSFNFVKGWNTISCPFDSSVVEAEPDPNPYSLYTFRVVFTNEKGAKPSRHSYYIDNVRIVKK